MFKKKKGGTYRCDFLIDLSRVGAFAVRVLSREHFEDTHAKGIYVNKLVVLFFVKFWGHEFRCP